MLRERRTRCGKAKIELSIASQIRKCMCTVLFTIPNTNVLFSSCYKTNEVVIQLYEYRGKHEGRVEVCSKTVSLQDDELYATEEYTSE